MEPIVPGARSFLKTSPPFITNFTRSVSLISASGSPETATMSANLPFVIDPISFRHRISVAALMVPACKAPAGVMPPILTSAVNSRAFVPSRHAAPWDPLPSTVTTSPCENFFSSRSSRKRSPIIMASSSAARPIGGQKLFRPGFVAGQVGLDAVVFQFGDGRDCITARLGADDPHRNEHDNGGQRRIDRNLDPLHTASLIAAHAPCSTN